jgi:hypothetical protein
MNRRALERYLRQHGCTLHRLAFLYALRYARQHEP